MTKNRREIVVNHFYRDHIHQATELSTWKAYLNQNFDFLNNDTLSSIPSFNSKVNSSSNSKILKVYSRNKLLRRRWSIYFPKNFWITSCTTAYAKNKLTSIFKRKSLVPKQCLELKKILVILIYHWNDSLPNSSYHHFKCFAYQTLLKKSDQDSSQLPNTLTWNIWDLIIQLWGLHSMKK